MNEALPVERVHGPGCDCHRCVGAQPGNGLAEKHGAYCGSVKLDARATEIADEVRPTLPLYSPADEPVLRLLALALVRIERAAEALAAVDRNAGTAISPYLVDDAERLGRLRSDLRSWINTARNLANDLGLTPTSRARLGFDLVRTEDALAQLAATGAEIRVRRGLGVIDGG